MGSASTGLAWRPATKTERYQSLDVLRGLALFGVLLVNLETLFRVSLFQHILTFHTEAGRANHLVDVLVVALLEFKAFTLFSFLFGVGTALQAERASTRGISLTPFLLRRFLVLFAIGLIHMFVIWNGDILLLYAVCGLLLIPVMRLSSVKLLILGAVATGLPYWVPIGLPWPGGEEIRGHILEANQIYGHGSFLEILAFRWNEAWVFILPLVVGVLPRTLGIMIWGAALWRSGILREPKKHRSLLRRTCFVSAMIGGAMTAVHVIAKATGKPPLVPEFLVEAGSSIPLALAYAAGVMLWPTSTGAAMRQPSALLLSVAAMGQMALTNYLLQSVILGFVFYGYGLGLFGRLGSASAAWIGLALYVVQLIASRWWLRRYRFGPFEWLWRSLTYGTRQPMLLSSK